MNDEIRYQCFSGKRLSTNTMIKLPRPTSLRLVRHAMTVASPSASSSGPRFSALGKKAADEINSKWRGTTADGGRTKNYIGGEFTESKADKWLEVRDPVGGSV